MKSAATGCGHGGFPTPFFRMKAVLILILAARSLMAGEESGPVAWQSVVIRTEKVPGAGVIAIEATVEGSEWKALKVEAQGNTTLLTPEDLRVLEGYPLSGLRITHEGGYQPIGGHVVSLRFEKPAGEDGRRGKETLHLMIPRFGPCKLLVTPE